MVIKNIHLIHLSLKFVGFFLLLSAKIVQALPARVIVKGNNRPECIDVQRRELKTIHSNAGFSQILKSVCENNTSTKSQLN